MVIKEYGSRGHFVPFYTKKIANFPFSTASSLVRKRRQAFAKVSVCRVAQMLITSLIVATTEAIV
jgi:hypothetical protein